MRHTADIEYIEDLLEEFEVTPNQRISTLIDRLEDDEEDEGDEVEDDSDGDVSSVTR